MRPLEELGIGLAKKNEMKMSIQYKITLIFGIIIALILSCVYLYLNNSLREDIYQRIRTNLLRETLLTKSFLEKSPVKDSRYQEIDEIADGIGKDLNLRVTIIDLDGVVIGDSELDGKQLLEVENHLYRPEVQNALKSGVGENRRFSATIKKDMFYIASVYGKEKRKGIVRLAIPLLEIEIISNRLKKTLAVSFLIAFVLAIIVSFLVSLFISKPLREMAFAAKAIAKGDLSRKITAAPGGEIGDLAKAFSYMSEQIKIRIQEVTTSKTRLEAVLLSMFEGVMVIDLKGTILLMNQPLKDFLAVKENPIGKRPLEVIRSIEIQEITDVVLRMKQGVESREISLLLGQEKILLVHATPIIREDSLEGAVLVFHDITNLRKLEKIRQDFVANVSHELRTPITSIKGYAETLLNGALKDKKNAGDFLKIIYSDSDRLAKLINDLLDLSKIESGKLNLVLKSCEIKPLVSQIVSRLEAQAKAKSLTVNIDVSKRVSNILSDEDAIAQILLNLIDNAIKYSSEKGKIIISAKEKGSFLQVDISDTGIGIPEKDLPRIFERFYRVDKAHSRELGGTGLGLSIVKHIVQAHNGEVFVRSVLGQGSTFSFTIPKA